MLSRGLKVQIEGEQADVPSKNKIVARRLQKHEKIAMEEVTNNPSKNNIVARRKIAVRRRKINN